MKAQQTNLLAGTSTVFSYVCVRMQTDPDTQAVRFDREIEMPGKGYRWDNPGARVCFRTDARHITAKLFYSDRHLSKSARNGKGLYSIDARTRPEWVFDSAAVSIVRAREEVSLSFPVPSRGFHDYAIVMPYGDSVEFQGLTVNEGARFEPFPSPPAVRYIAFGDSITQGFTASSISRTYPFLLAENNRWQLLNLGFGGRSAVAADGKLAGALGADVMTILIGVNDWQEGVPLEKYEAQMKGLLANIRSRQPDVPIFLITPLWVDPSWKPARAISDLESYRQILRSLTGRWKDPHLRLIEGPGLINPDPKYFDEVAVHPNDAGFSLMANRLSKEIGLFRAGK